jgi:small subunit ribosomal protein S17
MDKTIKKPIKTVSGKVVSTKMKDTVIVAVVTMTRHELYNKAMKRTKRFAAHIEGIEVAVGDMVSMTEIKPMSKTKHYKVIEKISK